MRQAFALTVLALATALSGPAVAQEGQSASAQVRTAEPDEAPTLVGADFPGFRRRPEAEDMLRVYPKEAFKNRAAGGATLFCTATADGRLTACRITDESPSGAGFGAAALKLAPQFRLNTKKPDGSSVEGGTVRIPIGWNPPRGF